MKTKVTIWIYAILASCGAALGILTASSVHATSTHDVYVNPGGSTNSLKCGWHSVCESPYSWGNALDWGNDPYTGASSPLAPERWRTGIHTTPPVRSVSARE